MELRKESAGDSCVYCPHCEENVSRSTYRRHQLLLKRKHKLLREHSDSESTSESSSDDDLPCLAFGGPYSSNNIENGK